MNYRCGYCGHFTDKDGNPISDIPPDGEEELVHGECCVNQIQHEEEMRTVTREMAMDAQDMRLEGTEY